MPLLIQKINFLQHLLYPSKWHIQACIDQSPIEVPTCSVTWLREVAMIQRNNNWGSWEFLSYTSKNYCQLKQETKYSLSNRPYELSNNAQFSGRQDYKSIFINSSLVKSCSISCFSISLFVPSNSRTWLVRCFLPRTGFFEHLH